MSHISPISNYGQEAHLLEHFTAFEIMLSCEARMVLERV